MVDLDIPVTVFSSLLRKAFDRFYAELIASPYLSDFLKDADLEHLKAAQLANFLESVQDDESIFFLRYKHLGYLHFEQGLPYVEYHDAFNLLHKFLIEAEEELSDAHCVHDAIDIYIQRAKNASAAGYLEPTLENDCKTLRRQIAQQIDIKAVKEHLQWILEVIDDIRRMNTHPEIEFDYHECKCGRWLYSEEAEKYIDDPQVRMEILQTHHEIHQITRNIYRSIARRDYHKIFIDYIILVRQSMYLYSELNINVTQQSLIEDVSKDALTGLMNRRYLNEVLKSEVHLYSLNAATFSVVMFDLDRFKTINDTCGHQAGDAVIVAFADVLKQHVRKTDNLFRYGGEEFLAVLPGTTAEEAGRVSEKVRTDFGAREWEGCLKAMTVTVSSGVSEYSERLKENPRRVIFEADMNLYRAKQLGRNRTIV